MLTPFRAPVSHTKNNTFVHFLLKYCEVVVNLIQNLQVSKIIEMIQYCLFDNIKLRLEI